MSGDGGGVQELKDKMIGVPVDKTPVDVDNLRDDILSSDPNTGAMAPGKSAEELEEKNNKLEADKKVLQELTGNLAEERKELIDLKTAAQEEAEALQEAHGIDSMTGLFNRRYVEIEAARLDSQRKVHGINYAVALMDLDSFKKSANDKYGHPVGDDVLKLFASVLTPVLRDEDIPGRLGGDEYIILLPIDSGKDPIQSVNLENRLDTTLKKALLDKYPQLKELQNIGVSIGLATSSDENPRFDDILKEADRLLYERKSFKGSHRE